MPSSGGRLQRHGRRLDQDAAYRLGRFVEQVLKNARGFYELHDIKRVADEITHELLVGAFEALSNAIDADERLRRITSGRTKLRYLTKLVAMAVGGSVVDNDDLHHKIGKRLSAQVTTVNDALGKITSDGAAAHSQEQHRVHIAPELLVGLADRLEALTQSTESQIDVQLTEIYVGFHELRLPVRNAPLCDAPVCVEGAPVVPPAAQQREPNAERMKAAAIADALAATDKEWDAFAENVFNAGRNFERSLLGIERGALRHSNLEVEWYRGQVGYFEKRVERLEKELAEKDEKTEKQVDELYGENAAQEDRIISLEVELRVAREREAVLRDVIRENCMSMAGRASCDSPPATQGHV